MRWQVLCRIMEGPTKHWPEFYCAITSEVHQRTLAPSPPSSVEIPPSYREISRFHESNFLLPAFDLSHADFSSCNIIVHQDSGRLVDVIDWAEAAICAFGENLYKLQNISGALYRENGWRQYKDHNTLQKKFWQTFQQEVGGLSAEVKDAIRSARILGCLLSHIFTRSPAIEPFLVPVHENDEVGRYYLQFLDAYLVDMETRFEDLK